MPLLCGCTLPTKGLSASEVLIDDDEHSVMVPVERSKPVKVTFSNYVIECPKCAATWSLADSMRWTFEETRGGARRKPQSKVLG